MKIHIFGRNALNCALYLEFNAKNPTIKTIKKYGCIIALLSFNSIKKYNKAFKNTIKKENIILMNLFLFNIIFFDISIIKEK